LGLKIISREILTNLAAECKRNRRQILSDQMLEVASKLNHNVAQMSNQKDRLDELPAKPGGVAAIRNFVRAALLTGGGMLTGAAMGKSFGMLVCDLHNASIPSWILERIKTTQTTEELITNVSMALWAISGGVIAQQLTHQPKIIIKNAETEDDPTKNLLLEFLHAQRKREVLLAKITDMNTNAEKIFAQIFGEGNPRASEAAILFRKKLVEINLTKAPTIEYCETIIAAAKEIVEAAKNVAEKKRAGFANQAPEIQTA
jgi:hypothetical protein